MAAIRFKIKKFDGETNFNLWKVLMMAILVQISLKKLLPVLQEVWMEKTSSALWKRLKTLYATKTLANGLVLKQHLNVSYERRATESNEEDVTGANLADESSDDFLLVSTSDNSKLTSEWVLDSGCSFHMCPKREWFSTQSSVEGRVVRMENDLSSKVIGIGTIKIRIHNRTIRTLSDVRYVPDLRKNLISLSILDLKGCTMNIESSGIKVSLRVLVLLKGKRTDSLYILEGSTVTGEIGCPSSITESK
ncbi:hypothetical protein CXB51_002923 [Gossypium anomalum]|uniref:Retrovirus-related Pol polyprotein from transposon TNT 1-94-like beta-barrel domain-containing protein n=1 Tax=Gossypium anomalum TaxID=47600 RepID=A0A8J5ZGG1_9ROSI|nr:hypothetical protein CXB51_002923 [Gossypium anomalum]